MDILSKSDPICVVYLKGLGLRSDEYFEIGRTEVIYNDLNPKWNTKIQLDYFFEVFLLFGGKQRLRAPFLLLFSVYLCFWKIRKKLGLKKKGPKALVFPPFVLKIILNLRQNKF